jgi:type II secretory pathway pseudopilin PulG
MISPEQEGEAGFTMVEVLVAFVIATLGLTMIYSIFGNYYRNAADAHFKEQTLTFARSHFDLVVHQAGALRTLREGHFENGARWTLQILPITNPDLPQDALSRPIRFVIDAFDAQDHMIVRLETINLEKHVP